MAQDYDITAAFKAIEDELIASMIRNLERHRAEEEKEGILWSQWQTEQLRALEAYKVKNQKKYKKQFEALNKRIESLIQIAHETGSMEQEIEILEAIKNGFRGYHRASSTLQAEFFQLNERKLDALIQATTADMQKAETAVLRMANDQYRKAVFNAQVYANTGAGTYEKAVDMATKSMLAAGLNCVQYANGARHTLSDYADMAIRTAAKRAYLQGEGQMRQEWGIATVIMNKRGNPCPKCLPWVGKVLIDDVWSGGTADGAKYPLMSYAISKGLYHPRCKDSHTTYFQGISTADDTWTKEELEAVGLQNKEEVKQQYAKRQAEKYGRLAEYSIDSDNKKMYDERLHKWERRRNDNRIIRKHRENDSDSIIYDIDSFNDASQEKIKRCYSELTSEYNSPLKMIKHGASGKGVKADTDITGEEIQLNTSDYTSMAHEFFHTLANTKRDKFGLSDHSSFWKEIKAIRREYNEAVVKGAAEKISSYAGTNIDEFAAECFAQVKSIENGYKMTWEMGTDTTYSKRVVEVVDKYFGKKR